VKRPVSPPASLVPRSTIIVAFSGGRYFARGICASAAIAFSGKTEARPIPHSKRRTDFLIEMKTPLDGKLVCLSALELDIKRCAKQR